MAGAVAREAAQGTPPEFFPHQQAFVILSGAQRQSKDAAAAASRPLDVERRVRPSTIRFADAQDDAVLGRF